MIFEKKTSGEEPLSVARRDLAKALNAIKDMESAYARKEMELESEHKIALKEKEFDMKHFKDEELKKMQEELVQQRQETAVLKKENELLVKITDLNADVIDVKELMNSLIKKLPEINLQNLTINSNGAK
mgnify:CR=1 FL=1